ncbi:MAG: hypothetical protein ACQET5_13420 [Halobacteriota archaeon]|uniref:hypothetical protein n=1 Tax=Natronomonas sp. TaxID=2184060 RepID=UPI0039753EB8
MNRRNVLIGLGGLVAGGGALLGTGAFTTVEAERTVTVNTAGDAGALLAFEASGDGVDSDVVTTDNDLLVIDFDAAANDGEGVNLDALTTVGEVSGDPIDSLDTAALTITNNGAQTVDINFDIGFNSEQALSGNDVHDVLKLWTDASGSETINSNNFGNLVENDLEGLEAGQSVEIALQIDTTGLDTNDVDTSNPLFESEATITATSTSTT